MPSRYCREHSARNPTVWSCIITSVLILNTAPAVGQNSAQFEIHQLQHTTALESKRILTELLGDMRSQVRIFVDSEQQQLLLSGPAEAQTLARALIAKIDRPRKTDPAPAQRVLRTYRRAPGQLQSSAALLKQVFTGQDIRVAVDTDGSQLIVVGSSEVHRRIERMFTQVRSKQPPKPIRADSSSATAIKPSTNTEQSAEQSQTITLEFRAPQTVQESLARLLGSRLKQDAPGSLSFAIAANRRVRIQIDPQHKQFRISGTRTLVQQFAVLVRQIDAAGNPAGRVIQFVPATNVDPTALKQALKAYHSAQPEPKKESIPPQGGVVSDSQLLPAAYFQDGSASKQPDSNPAAAAADDTSPQTPAPQTPAPQTPAAKPKQATDQTPLSKPVTDVEIQTLDDLDVIILRGRGADVQELTRIIREIERLSAEMAPEIEVYHLSHVEGEAVRAVANQVLEALTENIQGRVSVTPLIKPNALLLIGWGEALKKVKELLAQLDTPVQPESQMRVFNLRHAGAESVRTAISQFFDDREGLGTKLRVTANTRTNALVIHAAPRDMREIELLIKQLDTSHTDSVNRARVVRLKNSLASDLATTLRSTLEAARGAGDANERSAAVEMLMVTPEGSRVVKSGLLDDVRITPDVRTNTLILSGPSQSLPLLETLIQRLDEAPASTAQIKVFQIDNADASELVLVLRTLFPAQASTSNVPQLATAANETSLVPVRFSVDTRTNTIIATGSSGDLRIIESLVLRLDQNDARERINKVYRLKNAPALDVAQAINEFLRNERLVQQAAPGQANQSQQIETEVVVVPEPVGNSLIISATERYFEEISKLVDDLDEQPPQVMIQVIIAEVQLDNRDELGIEAGLQDSLMFDRSLLGDLVTTTTTTQTPQGNTVVTSTDQVIQAASLTPGFLFNNQALGNSGSDKALATASSLAGQALSSFATGRVNTELGYGGLVLSASSENLSLLIRALSDSRHVEILSRPQVMTLDNQPAFIQVGERVPRIVGSTINQTGQVNNIELENVGLILGVTPRISPDGMVVMEIDAEKSHLGSESDGIPVSVSTDGSVIRSPRVNLTTAQTTVSAASGQTIVLGGLITNEMQTVARRVPWLSEIPLLGNLFRYDGSLNSRKELLIILTPRVIRNSNDADVLKQLEIGRISWCSSDLFDMLDTDQSTHLPTLDTTSIPTIFPDVTPAFDGNLKSTLADVPAPESASDAEQSNRERSQSSTKSSDANQPSAVQQTAWWKPWKASRKRPIGRQATPKTSELPGRSRVGTPPAKPAPRPRRWWQKSSSQP